MRRRSKGTGIALLISLTLLGTFIPVPRVSAAGAPAISVRKLSAASPGASPYWSPNGNLFAYQVSISAGTAELGSLRPFALRLVRLGQGTQLVGLTNRYLIGAQQNFARNYLYPILHGGRLGAPEDWVASADHWENWVPISGGLALETGGYQRGTLTLTLQGGGQVALHGGEMYLSADRRYGAVLGQTRTLWHLSVAQRLEIQPSTGRHGIAVWDLSLRTGPRHMATLRLPKERSSASSGPLLIQTISFSPGDRYVAVLLANQHPTGSLLTGVTYIYTVQGKLVGRAPYGNGLHWLPKSDELWLGTPHPQGQGQDLIVGIHGQKIASWQDSVAMTLLPISTGTALAQRANGIGLIEGGHFHTLRTLPHDANVQYSFWSPNGRAALFSTTKGRKSPIMWMLTQH